MGGTEIYWDEPGRGRKRCPGCNCFVPARLIGQCPAWGCTYVWKRKRRLKMKLPPGLPFDKDALSTPGSVKPPPDEDWDTD